jgi:hypothetical protein
MHAPVSVFSVPSQIRSVVGAVAGRAGPMLSERGWLIEQNVLPRSIIFYFYFIIYYLLKPPKRRAI